MATACPSTSPQGLDHRLPAMRQTPAEVLGTPLETEEAGV
jgi:hypothetical protein